MGFNPRTPVLVFALLSLAGCAQSRRTIEEQNKTLVNRFGEALNGRDFATVRQLLAPDFVRHSQATPDLATANADQFVEYLKADAASFPDSRQTLERIVAEGDLVAVWIRYEGTQEGQMGPFPPSHKRMQVEASGIFRVQDGKLAELWITWDNLAALTQLGHFPPPGKQP